MAGASPKVSLLSEKAVLLVIESHHPAVLDRLWQRAGSKEGVNAIQSIPRKATKSPPFLSPRGSASYGPPPPLLLAMTITAPPLFKTPRRVGRRTAFVLLALIAVTMWVALRRDAVAPPGGTIPLAEVRQLLDEWRARRSFTPPPSASLVGAVMDLDENVTTTMGEVASHIAMIARRLRQFQWLGTLVSTDGRGRTTRTVLINRHADDVRHIGVIVAIVEQAAATLPRPTQLFVDYGDNGKACGVVGSRQWQRLAAAFPNLFLLSFNPCFDVATNPSSSSSDSLLADGTHHPRRASHGRLSGGFLPVRTIPIPDDEALRDFAPFRRGVIDCPDSSRSATLWQDRSPDTLVVWRGSTTGAEVPYSVSPRHKLVAAFHHVPRTDVYFSGRTQSGVNLSIVPPTFMRREINRDTMLRAAKVVVDADGNGNAWSSLRWKLCRGGTVVKLRSPTFTQWYYPYLKHGEHVWMIDPPADDRPETVRAFVSEVLSVASNRTLCDQLSQNAMNFGRRHLAPRRAQGALYDAVATVWESVSLPRKSYAIQTA